MFFTCLIFWHPVWYHRNTEKDHRDLFPTLCHGQGQLPLDQVTQSPIQPGQEHFQGWSIHSSSGQPVPLSEWGIFFLISNLSQPSLSAKPFPFVLSLHAPVWPEVQSHLKHFTASLHSWTLALSKDQCSPRVTKDL